MDASQFYNVLPSGVGTKTIFDMSPEEIKTFESRMRPGGYSSSGFISENESFKDVCLKDLATLKKLNISCEQISDYLLGVIKKAKQVAEKLRHTKKTTTTLKELKESLKPVSIGNRFKVSGFAVATNGYQECPFSSNRNVPCHKGRQDFTVINLRTKESISFSALAIDLIGKHAFFEGHTPYRIDPKQACRVLEIKPGNYNKVIEKSWKWRSGILEVDFEEEAKEHAEEVFKIDDFATAYFGVPYINYKDYKYRGLTNIERIRQEGKDEGKKYCHVFNHKKRNNGVISKLRDIKLDCSSNFKGTCVYEYVEETYAEIRENSRSIKRRKLK